MPAQQHFPGADLVAQVARETMRAAVNFFVFRIVKRLRALGALMHAALHRRHVSWWHDGCNSKL